MTRVDCSTGVAIVGIACRFPGAPDQATFWQNLCSSVESVSTLSDEERMSSIHLVEPDGERFARGAALTQLIHHLGLPAPAGLLGRAYGPVARNRGKFGRRVPDGRAPRRYP